MTFKDDLFDDIDTFLELDEFAETVKCVHCSFGNGVVTIDDAYFMLIDVFLVHSRNFQCRSCSHVSVLGFFRHELSQISGNERFQVRGFYLSA